jgi:hypothetical protein
MLQNLVEALDQVFHTHRAPLDAVNDSRCRQGVPLTDGTMAVAVPPPSPTGQEKTAQRQARRVECHQQVWALRAQVWPGHAIAAHLGIGKSTVFRSLRTATLPERTRRRDRGRSILNPYKPYLLDRWNAGCRDALRLYGEIQPRGYPGSYATVARYAQRLRQAPGQDPRQRPSRRSLPIVALQRFAKGLADDYDAIKAGLTLPWSTGPVEGHITRLKRLKRQMFGRGGASCWSQDGCRGVCNARRHCRRHRPSQRPHSHAHYDGHEEYHYESESQSIHCSVLFDGLHRTPAIAGWHKAGSRHDWGRARPRRVRCRWGRVGVRPQTRQHPVCPIWPGVSIRSDR